MLPVCRTADETFAIPQFALTRSDIDAFMDELRGFHTAFRACFARQEPRDQFFNYMVGQFSALERKSIEPMALQVEGGKVRAMQRLVSDALWDEAAMLETYHRLVQDEMGEADGVLSVSSSVLPSAPRQGERSGSASRPRFSTDSQATPSCGV
jgi:DDE superfamily endonuclease